ncbi:glycosyltransferase family 61 protein [Promicromonospora vindobonensis]|uniref:Glycosyltransferase family 61 protein n=1 Tax=Promicromonospora vindobonensis TaxID=195748 RepID=A0ABW5W0W9_9MICO
MTRTSASALQLPGHAGAWNQTDIPDVDLTDRHVVVITDSAAPMDLARAVESSARAVRVRLMTSTAVPTDLRSPTIVVTPVTSVRDMFNAIASGPAPDVIIEALESLDPRRSGAFGRLFLALNDEGAYIFARPGGEVRDTSVVWDWLRGRVEREVAGSDDRRPRRRSVEQAIGEAISSVTVNNGSVVVRKSGQHLMKIYNLLHRPDGESRLETAVQRRAGARAVERIATIPAEALEVETDLRTNNPDLAMKRFKRRYDVRPLVARVIRDALCAPRQIISVDGLLLPESSMQPRVQPMYNRSLIDDGDDYAEFPVSPGEDVAKLSGTYFHLDNEYPGHFGHVTSQDLTKLWAWESALYYDPDCRVLLSPPVGKSDLNEFQYRLLAAFGITRDRVTLLRGPVRVERLINATFGLQNPYFVSPRCKDIWQRIGAEVAAKSTVQAPKRLFVSRGDGLPRRCINGQDVEQVFRDAGFEIILPEQFDIADQIKMFREAEVVAGYAGSAMFNMVYSSAKTTWFVIGSRSYTATTEYLLAALYDDPIRYFFCDPVVEQPDGGWSSEAYFSNYTFNFERDGESLDRWLAEL